MGMERIQAYNAGFYICLVITILGVLLSILFFFTLHIKDAWKMSSGRARNESIRKIEKATEVMIKRENCFTLTKNIIVIHTEEKI
mgnify:FL=1